MFKNGQLALLPQHMWQENKYVRGRHAKEERETRKKQTNQQRFLFFFFPPVIPTFDLQARPENWKKENILLVINTKRNIHTSVDATCVQIAAVVRFLRTSGAKTKRFTATRQTTAWWRRRERKKKKRGERGKTRRNKVKQSSDFKAAFYPICLEF